MIPSRFVVHAPISQWHQSKVGDRARCTVVWAVLLGLALTPTLPAELASQETPPHTLTLPGVAGAPFPYLAPEELGLSSEGLKELVAGVQGWVEDGEIIGAELLLVKDRTIVLHETLGWRDRDAALPLERNSFYRIRSMTKPFTGTSILLLKEEGKLALDDPVSNFLPSWRNEASEEITIRQLLSHTGGFVQGGFPSPFQRYETLREAVDAVGEAGPQKSVGEGYEYSDVGSATLGAVVEELSGLPVERFIETRILDPVGLMDTKTFFDPGLPWAAWMNPTYARSSGSSPWVQYWHPTQEQAFPFFRASGGLYTTILDYARWLTVFVDLGAYPGGRLLTEETVREALSPGLSTDYGLHWEIFSPLPDDGGLPAFGHGGSDGTLAMAIPSEDLLVLIFTQSRGNGVLRRFPPGVRRALDLEGGASGSD